MSAAVETFLARLYTDAALREAFIANPKALAQREGFSGSELDALAATDLPGLRLAAESYERKRRGRTNR